MAKRFYDTSIWDEDWLISMPMEYILFWFYILGQCDHAGIWRPNIIKFNKIFNCNILKDNALQYFNTEKTRVHVLKSGRWFISQFIPFQYGKVLNLNSKTHLSVYSLLLLFEIDISLIYPSVEVLKTSNRPLEDLYQGVKDKDKDKDIKKGGYRGKENRPPTVEEVALYCQERKNGVNPNKWHAFYEAKGWMIGKNKMKDWKASVRTWEDGLKATTKKVERPDVGVKVKELLDQKVEPIEIKFRLLSDYSEKEIDEALGKKY